MWVGLIIGFIVGAVFIIALSPGQDEDDGPECESCLGTGGPAAWEYPAAAYWMGEEHQVCGACKGSGRNGQAWRWA